jgi:glycosyltransferase involved in cell wall biosynthesis
MDSCLHPVALIPSIMTMSHGKVVALIDPIWNGHHPMYFSQFSASFLRCGARIIGLCPEPAAALENLARAVDERTTGQLGNLIHYAKLPTGKRSFFNGRFEGDPVRTLVRWKTAADSLAEAEAASGMRADLVYFPYLDSYLRFLPVSHVPEILLNRPWCGLYLRNHHHGEVPSLVKSLRLLAKGDSILRSRLNMGVGVLDERYITAMEKLIDKPVTAYPDVTQGGLPAEPFALALEIKRSAAGRKIIGMIGLERRKGFLTLLRTARLAGLRNLPYYFVCAGALNRGDYTIAEQEELDSILRGISSGEIHNLHFNPQLGRIRSELDFNSVFSSFDIAWAAYEGFHGSSGTLSKAAHFEIPCLATHGECIGDRVVKYGIGITIAESDPEHALAALPRIASHTDSDGQALALRFKEYREQHSLERLDRILADLLASLPEGSGPDTKHPVTGRV